jgi:hypothetical protein
MDVNPYLPPVVDFVRKRADIIADSLISTMEKITMEDIQSGKPLNLGFGIVVTMQKAELAMRQHQTVFVGIDLNIVFPFKLSVDIPFMGIDAGIDAIPAMGLQVISAFKLAGLEPDLAALAGTPAYTGGNGFAVSCMRARTRSLTLPVVRSVYDPATQLVQAADVVPAVMSPYLPAEQAVQLAEPMVSVLYAPMEHPVHTPDEVAAVRALYVPAPHAVQLEVPEDRALYSPAPQAEQTSVPLPSALEVPATHARVVIDTAPSPACATKCNPVGCKSPQPKQCPKCDGIFVPIPGAFGCRGGISAPSGAVVLATRLISNRIPLTEYRDLYGAKCR